MNRIVRVKHRLASEKINAIATKLRIMHAFSGQFRRKRGSLDGEFPSRCPFSAFDQGLSRPLNPDGVPLSGLVSIKEGLSSLFSGISLVFRNVGGDLSCRSDAYFYLKCSVLSFRLEVEDGDFSDLKGSALDVHSSVIIERIYYYTRVYFDVK